MKLTCKKCGTEIEIPPGTTQSPDARVECPGCRARYRLRPRKTPRPTADIRSSLTPATPLPTAVRTASSGATPASGDVEDLQDTVAISSGSRPARTLSGPVLSAGEVLAGRYRIVRFLAQGGMGEVYEAEDQELRQTVALKTISAHASHVDGAAGDRFKREIALARTVTHPNVCRIFDLGHHQPPPVAGGPPPASLDFLTMELLEGETLTDLLRRRERLSTPEALPLVQQMAAALGAAHGAGIVHRDFKCENVFLVAAPGGAAPGATWTEQVRAVVTDFGVARGRESVDRFAAQVTGAGIVGTPAYMAPEQVENGEITAATDIYALGIVIYEMVTGHLPFESENPLTTAVKRLKEAPPPPHVHVPDLPAWWEKAILRCLERQPGDRFASTEEVAQALAAPPQRPAARPAARAVPARPPSPGPPTAERPAGVPPKGDKWGLPPRPPSAGSDGGGRSRTLAAVLAAVVVLSAGLYLFNSRGDKDRPRVPRRSVAVLGFKNQTGRPEVAWLSTALSEMLGTELTRGEALRAIPGENVARARQQLGLADASSLAGEDLAKLRALLGCDFLVLGGYISVASGDGEEIRLDLRLQDAAVGNVVASIAREGNERDLFRIVTELGDELRDKLGIDAGGGEDPLSGLPADPEAARLYAEALDQLRDSRPEEARQVLQEAVRLAPENPLLHSALSAAWEALGYGQHSVEAAERAFELSSSLPREDRMVVEGRLREAQGDQATAIEIYGSLWELFPDNLEYGLRLVATQNAARRPQAALTTLGELRQLPSPLAEDPRIDLAEAAAAALLPDYERQLAASGRAAERAAAMQAGLLEAQARLATAQAYHFLGRPQQAEQAASAAHRLFAEVGHPSGEALALTTLANAHFDRAAFDEAIDTLHRAIDEYRRLGDQLGLASALNNLAVVHKRRGDLEQAQALYEETRVIFETTGDRLGKANALNNLGAVLVSRGQLAAAREMFESSRAVWQQLGARAPAATTLNNIAAVLRLQGELAESRKLHEAVLEVRRELGQKADEVTSLCNLAAVLRASGEIDAADRMLSQALALAREVENRSARAQALFELGEVRLAQGELEEARQHHEEALDLRRELAEKHGVTDSRVALARLALAEEQPETAEIESRQAIRDCQEEERAAEEARATAVLAAALLAQDRLSESRRTVAEAELLAGGSEQLAAALEVGLVAARVQAAAGDVAGAQARLVRLEERAAGSGHAGWRLEALLASAEIALAAGRAQDAVGKLSTVQLEAALHGFGRLERRAAAHL